MNLSNEEKRVLNVLFKDVSDTTRDTMVMVLYAAKPFNDSSSDAQALIMLLNGLIVKVTNGERKDVEAMFNRIPYTID